jgi:hypothetical protein
MSEYLQDCPNWAVAEEEVYDTFADMLVLAGLERQRQRTLPDDHEDKMPGYGRYFPIEPFYLAAEKRIAEILQQITQEKYYAAFLGESGASLMTARDRYVLECSGE